MFKLLSQGVAALVCCALSARAALRANGVRMVIIENATRLARDLMVREIILAEFRKIGACGRTPAEQKTVDAAVSLGQKDGKSYVRIAEQLNTEGVKPRSGAKWHPTQIQRILQRAEAK